MQTRIVSEEQLIAFLRDPQSYRHRPKTVRFIETHASYVFVATPYVFKVKRPVNLGFLDFSTLEKRRHFCEREIELNRRLAPGTYLGVVPISTRGDGLTLGEGGGVVEYAVQMHRLPERFLLKNRLRRRDAGAREVDRVADTLVRFYRAHPGNRATAEWGMPSKLRVSTDENFEQTRACVGDTLSAAAFESIRNYTTQFFKKQDRLLRKRVAEGWIRDCHGDLHLEHIHVTPAEVTIFDCIEFNDRFRYVDVASDIAFLAMDLDFNGFEALSRRLVDRVGTELGDAEMMAVMDFYKCYRAYVRGKVESLQSSGGHASASEQKRLKNLAARYFALALRYAAMGSVPGALVVMGRTASGKSSLAEVLSRELNLELVSSDATRKRLAGVPLFQRGDARERQELYSAPMSERVYGALLSKALASVTNQRSVILDATYSRKKHRAELMAKISEAGGEVRFIELTAPERVLKERLQARGRGGRHVSDARAEDFDVIDSKYETPEEIDGSRLMRIENDSAPGTALLSALRGLVELRA